MLKTVTTTGMTVAMHRVNRRHTSVVRSLLRDGRSIINRDIAAITSASEEARHRNKKAFSCGPNKYTFDGEVGVVLSVRLHKIMPTNNSETCFFGSFRSAERILLFSTKMTKAPNAANTMIPSVR